jgi:hypothetical protein
MHEMWSHHKNQIVGMLKSTSLSEVAQKIKNDDLRLTAEGDINRLIFLEK